MLEVQKYLASGKGLSNLKVELGIDSLIHSIDGRVILNYDMINSPKLNVISRECRGLTLCMDDWSLVSRSFFRFLNAGECKAEDKKFNWDNRVVCTHKEDGSLIQVFYYRGKWSIQTRGSFATGYINDSMVTWEGLVRACLDVTKLNKEYSYTFELCSLYNKIVRNYRTSKVYLLTAFYGDIELTHDTVMNEAKRIGVEFPDVKEFNDIFDVQAYIANIASNDASFEGLVCRDVHNNRLKCKSPLYLHLHRLNNNGNVASVKNLLPLIIAGETDEVLTYFSELKSDCDELQSKIDKAKKEIDNYWYCHHDEPSQKLFAKAIKDTKYSGILFQARKLNVHPFTLITSEYLLKVWGY